MDADDSWIRSSERHHIRYGDTFPGIDEMDAAYDEEDAGTEYACPFCFEDYDIIGLCCHIADDHPVEIKKGVCPICHLGFGPDMVAHITMDHETFFKLGFGPDMVAYITMDHETFFKMQHMRGHNKSLSGSPSVNLYLRKDLREGNLHAFGGSSHMVAPLSATPDPLLSSFMNLDLDDPPKDVRPHTLENGSLANKISDEKVEESQGCIIHDYEWRWSSMYRHCLFELSIQHRLFRQTLNNLNMRIMGKELRGANSCRSL